MTLGIGRDITTEEKLRDVSFSSIYFVFNFTEECCSHVLAPRVHFSPNSGVYLEKKREICPLSAIKGERLKRT